MLSIGKGTRKKFINSLVVTEQEQPIILKILSAKCRQNYSLKLSASNGQENQNLQFLLAKCGHELLFKTVRHYGEV